MVPVAYPASVIVAKALLDCVVSSLEYSVSICLCDLFTKDTASVVVRAEILRNCCVRENRRKLPPPPVAPYLYIPE